MPAQQGLGRDDQAQLAEAGSGQEPGQRGRDRPVGPGQPRSLGLALEHGDLMAEDQDLDDLDTLRPGEQGKPADCMQHREVGESY